jgi:hypothetical protein
VRSNKEKIKNEKAKTGIAFFTAVLLMIVKKIIINDKPSTTVKIL